MHQCLIRGGFRIICVQGSLPHFSSIRGNPCNKWLTIYQNVQKIILGAAIKSRTKPICWGGTSGTQCGFNFAISSTVGELQIRISNVNSKNVHYCHHQKRNLIVVARQSKSQPKDPLVIR